MNSRQRLGARVWVLAILVTLLCGGPVAAASTTAAVAPLTAASTSSLPQRPPRNAACKLLPKAARAACDAAAGVASHVPGVGAVVAGANSAAGLADSAAKTLEKFNPANIPETWAKAAARSSADVLAGTQSVMLELSHPNLKQQWFSRQYAVVWGIGLVLMAFSLVFTGAKLAQGGPDAADALRSAGVRATSFMPVCTIMPALVALLVALSYELAGWFGHQATGEAQTAIHWYVKSLASMQGMDGILGGAMSLLVVAGLVFLGAFVGMFELQVAQYGIYVVTLLMPALLGISVYPPARKAAVRVAAVLGGFLLAPVVMFFCYWVSWSVVGGVKDATTPMAVLNGSITVAVSAWAAVSVPVILWFVVPKFVGAGGHTGGPMSGTAAKAAAGSAVSGAGSRLSKLASQRGSGSSGSGSSSGKRSGPGSRSGGQAAAGVKGGGTTGQRPPGAKGGGTSGQRSSGGPSGGTGGSPTTGGAAKKAGQVNPSGASGGGGVGAAAKSGATGGGAAAAAGPVAAGAVVAGGAVKDVAGKASARMEGATGRQLGASATPREGSKEDKS